MTVPLLLLFVALLAAYMVYSVWARLDARYLVVGAIALLVGAAAVDATGASAAAAKVLEYVFLLLAAGVVLLLVDHLRGEGGSEPGSDGGPSAPGPAGEPADERQPAADQALDRPEQ